MIGVLSQKTVLLGSFALFVCTLAYVIAEHRRA